MISFYLIILFLSSTGSISLQDLDIGILSYRFTILAKIKYRKEKSIESKSTQGKPRIYLSLSTIVFAWLLKTKDDLVYVLIDPKVLLQLQFRLPPKSIELFGAPKNVICCKSLVVFRVRLCLRGVKVGHLMVSNTLVNNCTQYFYEIKW